MKREKETEKDRETQRERERERESEVRERERGEAEREEISFLDSQPCNKSDTGKALLEAPKPQEPLSPNFACY